jgi:phospholipid N-methyltransferase
MPPSAILRILRGGFSHLRDDGAFYQFTYGARCPVPSVLLKRLGLQASCLGRVTVNLPPASVYRIKRVLVPEALAAAPGMQGPAG